MDKKNRASHVDHFGPSQRVKKKDLFSHQIILKDTIFEHSILVAYSLSPPFLHQKDHL